MRPSTALAVMAVIAALGGCTHSQERPVEPAPSATVTSAAPQDTFTSANLVGLWGADPATAQESGTPWIRFDDTGKFGGFDGCNSVSGTWTLSAHGDVRARARVTTLVACPGRHTASFGRMKFDGERLALGQDRGAGETSIVARPLKLR